MRLDMFKPLVGILPEVKGPSRTPTLNEKISWTALVLILYFIMYHIVPFGAQPRGTFLEFLQVVLASKTGTLLTIGIGPIILASIFLQLFAGAKIIEVDFTKPEDKQLFSTAQKTLAIVLALLESTLFVYPGFVSAEGGFIGPSPAIAAVMPLALLFVLVTLQIAFASILLIFLDELTSRYGIGSGISLFIAAGVSLAVVQGTIMLFAGGEEMRGYPTVASIIANPSALAIPQILLAILPLLFTAIIILMSVYAEGVKVHIPIAFDKVRGFGSRFPVKLLYVSNIPVILTAALLANVNILGRTFFHGTSCYVTNPTLMHYIGCIGPSGYLEDGLLYMLTSFPNPLFVSGGYTGYLALFGGSTPLLGVPQVVHVLVYAVLYILMCTFFGRFWIDVAGMSAADIANQFTKTGLQVPGFRRDPRIIQALLEKYINTIALLGSIFVGILAVFADLTGAIGGGTGILLTTGIIYKLYDDLKTQKMLEAHPGIGSIFGL